jgi:hypothetical protein
MEVKMTTYVQKYYAGCLRVATEITQATIADVEHALDSAWNDPEVAIVILRKRVSRRMNRKVIGCRTFAEVRGEDVQGWRTLIRLEAFHWAMEDRLVYASAK